MPAEATLEAKGLWTNVNTLTGIPPGGTTRQTNMRVHKPGLMTPRRGRKSICSLEHGLLRIFDEGNFLIGFGVDHQVYFSSTNGQSWELLLNWVQAIKPVNPSWGMAHFYSFGLNAAFYFNTNEGIKSITTTDGGYRPAGVPYGLNTKVRSYDSPGTALPPNSRVGYRAVFGIRNPDGSVELGSPSQRAIAINTNTPAVPPDGTGWTNPFIEIVIPPGIVIGKHFWQLYRTYPSTDAVVDPGDEMSLVFEGEFKRSFTTLAISRFNNIATILTTDVHGLAVGDVINLDTRYQPPADQGTYTYMIGKVSELFGGNRVFKRYRINNTGPGAMTEINIGAVEAGHAYSNGLTLTPIRRWLHSKTLGYYIFVHPQDSKIHVFKDLGTVEEFNIPVGFQVDAAALSADATKLYIICPGVAVTALNYSYTTSLQFGIVDLVTRSISWNTLAIPIAPSTALGAGYDAGSDTMRIAFAMGASFVTKGSDGIERFVMMNVTPQMAGATRTYRLNYYATTDKGTTWTVYHPLNAQSPEYSSVPAPYIFDYTIAQVEVPDGRIIAFTLPYWTGVNAQSKWAGLVRTMFNIANARYFKGISVQADLQTLIVFYGTSTLVPAFPNNRTRYFLAGNFTIDGSLVTWSDFVYVGYDSNNISMSSGPDGGALVEKLNAALTVRTDYLLDSAGNVLLPAIDATIAAGSSAVQFKGLRNKRDVVFFEGTYIVLSVVDPTTFTVESAGPDFSIVPYASFVNFNVVSIIDNVAPGAVGPSLYTSPSQEGIGQANFPPPLAKDIETFRSYAFYANATIQAYLGITLFSVGTDIIDLQIGDFILIGNAWVEAAVAEDFPNARFKITLDSGSAYENIRLTVESLSECVNRYADARHGAVLVKNEDTLSPGSLYIRSLYFDTNVNFEVRRGSKTGPIAMSAWSPAVPANAIPTQQPNVIYYSKPSQGGAVPLLNSVRVGSDNNPILRIKATREVLFVFKREGIYAMRGYAPPWQVDPFDLSNSLMLPDALCQMDNNIFCVTDHGIMKVSDSGIELISLPIQNLLEPQFSTDTGQLQYSADRSFMFGDPSDHKLHLHLAEPVNSNPSEARHLVYDTYTNTWFDYGWNGQISVNINSQSINPIITDNAENHGLYYKKVNRCIWVNEVKTFTERKSYNNSDYIDDDIVVGVVDEVFSAPDGSYYYIHIASTDTFVNTNDVCVFVNSKTYYGINMVPQGTGGYVFLTRAFEGSIGDDVSVSYYIWTDVLYAPTYEVNIAALNHFRETNITFKQALFDYMRILFRSPGNSRVNDLDDSFEHVVVVNGFNEFNDSLNILEHYQVRTLVPREQQRCSVLTVGFQIPIGYMENEIEGVVILYNPGPMRRSR